MTKKLYYLLAAFITTIVVAREKEVTHLLEGNLALPTSQQPSPLFCLGQNIVDKGDIQLVNFFNAVEGKNKNFIDVIPSLFYGFTDNLALFIGIPVAITLKLNNDTSHGMQDMFVQLEYAFINKDALHSATQATVVGNIGFQTGSATKKPPTGYGATSFFIGMTLSHMRKKWYMFISPGAIFPTFHNKFKFGNSYMYQWGIGYNLGYKPSEWIVTAILEFFGTYYTDNKTRLTQPHTQTGNIFYIGPSLWIATRHFILELGAAARVASSFDFKDTDHYYVAAEISWKFN